MASAVAKIVKKYGVAHARGQQAFTIFDKFCKNKADLRCHCVPKHPHYCALGEVLKIINITCPEGTFLVDLELVIE